MNIHFRLAEPSLGIVGEEGMTLLGMMEILEYDY